MLRFISTGEAIMTFRAIFAGVALAVCGWAYPLSGGAQEAVLVVRHTDPPPMLRIDEIREDTPLSRVWTRACPVALGAT